MFRKQRKISSSIISNAIVGICRPIFFAVILVIAKLPAIGFSQQAEFPYIASVSESGATVRSGPAAVHYGTMDLSVGDSVQVWRHDPGGWIAIRPPEDSFSLVAADAIEMVDEDIARVVHAGAKAWVGTRLGQVEEPLWQVKLKRDEKLVVLGTIEIENEQGIAEVAWLQVSPPAGEFRWIHKDQLQRPIVAEAQKTNSIELKAEPIRLVNPTNVRSQSRNLESKEIPKTASTIDQSDRGDNSQQWPVRQASFEDRQITPNRYHNSTHKDRERKSSGGVHPTPISDGQQLRSQQSQGNGGWKPARRKLHEIIDQKSAISDRSGDRFASLRDYPSSNWSGDGTNGPRSNWTDTHQSTNTRSESASMFGSLNSIVDLELELSNQAVKSPEHWNLQALYEQAEFNQSRTSDSYQTSEYQRLKNKIRQFQAIQSRHMAASRLGQTNPSGGFYSTSSTSVERTQPQNATKYDATGILSELVREGGILSPAYVLQDRSGKITHHVRAAPGVNLRRYLNQEVGLIGHRGFNARLKLDHVAAERVVVLARHQNSIR